MLTVIAACLILLVFRDQPLITTAHAQELTGDKTVNVNIVAVNGHPTTDGISTSTLPVRVIGQVTTR